MPRLTCGNFCAVCCGRLPHLVSFKNYYYCRYCGCTLKHRIGWNTRETTHLLRCSKIPKCEPCDCDIREKLASLDVGNIDTTAGLKCTHPLNEECWEENCTVKA